MRGGYGRKRERGLRKRTRATLEQLNDSSMHPNERTNPSKDQPKLFLGALFASKQLKKRSINLEIELDDRLLSIGVSISTHKKKADERDCCWYRSNRKQKQAKFLRRILFLFRRRIHMQQRRRRPTIEQCVICAKWLQLGVETVASLAI